MMSLRTENDLSDGTNVNPSIEWDDLWRNSRVRWYSKGICLPFFVNFTTRTARWPFSWNILERIEIIFMRWSGDDDGFSDGI